jgi:hypothetical protein
MVEKAKKGLVLGLLYYFVYYVHSSSRLRKRGTWPRDLQPPYNNNALLLYLNILQCAATHSPRCSLYMYILAAAAINCTLIYIHMYIGAAVVLPRGKIRSGGCNMAVVCIRHINCSILRIEYVYRTCVNVICIYTSLKGCDGYIMFIIV